jgi:hypothetical protein
MARRRLGSWLILLGVIGAIASIIWWQNFYSGVVGRPPVECLYRLTGPCRMVSNVAGFLGAAAYDARLLWASGTAIIIGLFLQR